MPTPESVRPGKTGPNTANPARSLRFPSFNPITTLEHALILARNVCTPYAAPVGIEATLKIAFNGLDPPPFYVPVAMRVCASVAYSAGVRYPSAECGRSWLYSQCHLLDSSFASSTLPNISCSSSSSLSRAWKLSA